MSATTDPSPRDGSPQAAGLRQAARAGLDVMLSDAVLEDGGVFVLVAGKNGAVWKRADRTKSGSQT